MVCEIWKWYPQRNIALLAIIDLDWRYMFGSHVTGIALIIMCTIDDALSYQYIYTHTHTRTHTHIHTHTHTHISQQEKSPLWIQSPEETSRVWIYGSRFSVSVPYSTQLKQTLPCHRLRLVFSFCQFCNIWHKGLVTSRLYNLLDLYANGVFDPPANITRHIVLPLRCSFVCACRLYVSRTMRSKKSCIFRALFASLEARRLSVWPGYPAFKWL